MDIVQGLFALLRHYVDQGNVVARLAMANEQIADLRVRNLHLRQQHADLAMELDKLK